MRILFLFFFSSTLHASIYSEDFQYQISSEIVTTSEITKDLFIQIPTEILDIFLPQDREIVIMGDWEKPFFSAWASKHIGYYSMNFWGGFARLPMMTKATWAFTACHELGHIIGGAPYTDNRSLEWSSAEGQADHFAHTKCLPKYLELLEGRGDIDFLFGQYPKCLNLYSDFNNQVVCQHMQDAAVRFNQILLYMKLTSDPASFDNHLPEVEESILSGYPSADCRFEMAISFSLRLKASSKRHFCWFKEKLD